VHGTRCKVLGSNFSDQGTKVWREGASLEGGQVGEHDIFFKYKYSHMKYRIFLLITFILSLFLSDSSAQSSIQGKVTDESTGEPIIIGTVALYKDHSLVTGTDTDFDGNYFFSDLNPGIYDIEVMWRTSDD